MDVNLDLGENEPLFGGKPPRVPAGGVGAGAVTGTGMGPAGGGGGGCMGGGSRGSQGGCAGGGGGEQHLPRALPVRLVGYPHRLHLSLCFIK